MATYRQLQTPPHAYSSDEALYDAYARESEEREYESEGEAELAHCIFQWWKPRKGRYPYHGLAIRLIVLVQLSSCSVERVFSKLENSRKVCKENLKEDMTEIRLLAQVNGTLDDMYDALVVNYSGN